MKRITNQDALWFFEEELKCGKCNDDCLQCNSMEMAIGALEKQIPKKPIEDGYYNKPCVCPYCGQDLDYIECAKYCKNCGQALDWSDKK